MHSNHENSLQHDERTPLLETDLRVDDPRKPTPIPWSQYSLILLLQISEPFSAHVIYPFAPDLVRSLGITRGDEARVGYYVGLIESIFFLTQAITVIHWSRLSDSIGRKPVLLIGILGLSLSMFCFGLSTTFWGFVISRSVNGALNGNVGVIKSATAEMTDSTNIAKAFGYMPLMWSTGGTLGPIVGGFLSRPAEQFPQFFGNSAFHRKYPYFLACAFPATYCAVLGITIFFFFKETLASPIDISRFFWFGKVTSGGDTLTHIERNSSSERCPTVTQKRVPLRQVCTRPVIIAAANYSCLALIDSAFRTIQPLFYSTPIEFGGLGLSPSEIGGILSFYGVFQGFVQILCFSRLHGILGTKRMFMTGIFVGLPLFSLFPVINSLARSYGSGAASVLWFVVALQVIGSISLSLIYGAIFICISQASPDPALLGATNGLAQMTVSLVRAFAPASATSLFSLSIDKNLLHGNLVYCVMMAIVLLSLFMASKLPRRD